VTVEGVTRSSEPRSSFVPDNVPAKGEWYWIEVPAIAKAAGLPQDTQLIEVLSFWEKQHPLTQKQRICCRELPS